MNEGGFVNTKGPLGQISSYFILIRTFFGFNENLSLSRISFGCLNRRIR